MMMKTTMMAMFTAALVAMSLGACGDSGGSNSGGSVAIGDLKTKYVTALCDRAFACCSTAELGTLFGGTAPADVNACITQLTSGPLGASLDNEIAAVTAGTVTYHGDNAGACIDAFNAQACSAFTGGGNAPAATCNQVFLGTVAAGGNCPGFLECAPGTTCTVSNNSATCVTNAVIGGDCSNAGCPDGAFCDGTAGITCVAKKASGAACTDSNQCSTGFCSGDSTTPGTCGTEPPTCTGGSRVHGTVNVFGHDVVVD